MALRFLLDTSVITRSKQPAVGLALHALSALGQVGRCRVSDLEIGFSARSANEWDKLRAEMTTFERVEIIDADLARAGQVQRSLAAAGKRG